MALPWHGGLVMLEPAGLMPVSRGWRLPGADMGVRCPMQLRARFVVQFSHCFLHGMPKGA